MLAIYATALAITAVALIVGRALCLLSGYDRPAWLAAPVGIAALMFICDEAIRLPGHAWTAVAVVIAIAAASVVLVRRRGASWPSLSDTLPIGVAVLILASLPFAANGRAGVLGISFDNDTHWHLILAEGLRHPAIQRLDTYGPGYPLGPHAIAATFAQLFGTDVGSSLTGLLMATPILTGFAALGLLEDLPASRRWLVATLAAIPYMLAAAYVISGFKEPILALLMLGLVIAARTWGRVRTPARWAGIPFAVLLAGVLYVYSYPGLVWPVVCAACWILAELISGRVWRRPRFLAGQLRTITPAALLGAIVLVVLVAPQLSTIHTFWLANGGTSTGNSGGVTRTALAELAGPLSTYEGLNVWRYGDFRFVPPDSLTAGVLVGLALVVIVYSFVQAIERRETAWLGATVGMILIYVYTKHSQSPYVASKAMMIPAPLLMIGGAGALMRRLSSPPLARPALLAVALGSIAFPYFAFESDVLVLRDAQVGPNDHLRELRSLRPLLHGQPTLVLFYDDYFKWELQPVPASSPLFPSPNLAYIQPGKPWAYGQALDFDSVSAFVLNQFAYVITTRTYAQSQPPSNFELVRQTASYEVWKRIGPTASRLVLAESGQPAATLNCATPAGRRLAKQRGVAAVRDVPRFFPVGPLVPGQGEQVVVKLPPGRWELSLPYVSPQAVLVTGGDIEARLPPNLDRPGPIWPVARITSTGSPMTLTFAMQDPGLISSTNPWTQYFTPQQLIAVRPVPDQLIPLRRACGRYIDWYQLH